MFHLVETQAQLDEIYLSDDTYIRIISNNDNYHPFLRESICLIYVRPMNYPNGFMICIDHPDANKISVLDATRLLNKSNNLYSPQIYSIFTLVEINAYNRFGYFICDDKGRGIFKPTIRHGGLWYDLELANIFFGIKQEKHIIPTLNSRVNEEHTTHPKLSQLIPIAKHYEACENEFKCYESAMINLVMSDDNYKFHKFNNYRRSIHIIQNAGIGLDKEKFCNTPILKNPELNIAHGKIYSEYHFSHLTTRPYNSFNGFSFNTLQKVDDRKSMFIPKNDMLVEMDYKSFHIYLIGGIIGDFSCVFDGGVIKGQVSSLYTVLGKLMLNKSVLSIEEEKSCKKDILRQIYGGVEPKYLHIPFFESINNYTHKQWNEYIKNDNTYVTKDGRIISNIEGANPSKLFNYIIQSEETANNMHIIRKIDNILKGKKTKIIMYNFDSFLFDVDVEESIIKQIRGVLVYPVQVKVGKDYNSLHIPDDDNIF